MTIIKPPRLRKKNLIGLIAPASPPSVDEKITKGVEYLERLGYRVKLGKHLRDQHGYLAGTDEARANDFNDMVNDTEVKAIFALRGGYGTPRLLQMINYRALKQHPKIIVGYSDLTALQLAVFRKTGLVTFSGPMPGVEMWKGIDPYTEEHFWRLLTSATKIGELPNPQEEPLSILQHGSATGRLLGGNFALMNSLMGTPFLPSLKKALLVLEDVDEAPHRVDRMLAQLLNANVLRNLSGLIFGRFTGCNPSDSTEPHLTIEQILKEYAAKIKCPVVANFQYGHVAKKLTLPIGLTASVDTHKQKITVLESGVR
jgi:muramoyltetrapeptide carboxypeptidase